MEKLFFCIWTDQDKRAANSYDYRETEEPINFFTTGRGYSKEEIDSINTLQVGQIFNCEFGNHYIRRIT